MIRSSVMAVFVLVLLGAAYMLLRGGAGEARDTTQPDSLASEVVVVAKSSSTLEAGPRKASERVVVAQGSEVRNREPVSEFLALRGRVRNASDDSPAAGFALEIEDKNGVIARVVTDDFGGFKTEAILSSGGVKFRSGTTLTQGWNQFDHKLEPEAEWLRETTGEVQLRVWRPRAVALARVVYADGAPAEGARVVLLTHTKERTSAQHVRVGVADKDGFVRYSINKDYEESFKFQLYADMVREDLASEVLEVTLARSDPPDEPVQLTLQPAAQIRVSVSDELGLPLRGAGIVCVWEGIGTLFLSMMVRLKTDENGEYLLNGLLPGTYQVSVGDPRDRSRHSLEIVAYRGAETPADFTLPAVDTQFAVSGRVIDENGAPLPSLFISIEKVGEEELWGTRADDEGHFFLWSDPVASLVVKVDEGLDTDIFAPASLAIPFGTKDVVIRRVRVRERREISLRVVDDATGDPIRFAAIWTYAPDLDDGDPSRREGFASADGIASVFVKQRDGLLWGVWARGYLDAEGLVAKLRTEVEPHEVRLKRGFDRRIQITNWYDGFGLAGAVVTDPATGETLATADDDGWVHVRGTVWPQHLRVSSSGYKPGTWECSSRNGWRHESFPMWEK